MKVGLVFPGQGAQSVGMGKDLYDKYEEIRNIYKNASEIAGVDIADLTFNSSDDKLSETKNTQLAVLVMSLGILEVLKPKANISAGLSLGEYTALIYSGILSFKDGIRIVKKRGEIMQTEVPDGEWAMAAIIGLEDTNVEELCKKIKNGYVVPANYNCPGQVVVSGEKQAVYNLMELAKTNGARKVIELKTGGPFHTTKLDKASIRLKKELDKIEFHYSNKKVIRNLDGLEYKRTDNIRENLAKHVISPVRFTQTIEEMIKQGVDTFVEIGPGKTLSGFIKKIDKKVNVFNVNNVETLNCVKNFI